MILWDFEQSTGDEYLVDLSSLVQVPSAKARVVVVYVSA